MISVKPENIPSELKLKEQWTNWAAVPTKDGFSKPPMTKQGTNGSSTDATKWSTYEEALEALGAPARYYVKKEGKTVDVKLSGIGFAGMELTNITGIDLDDCIDDGVINDFAQLIIDEFETYTEISPSGNGIRILLKGDKSLAQEHWSTSTAGPGKIECYDSGRFLTITGHQVDGTPATIEECQPSLNWLLQNYAPVPQPSPKRKAGAPSISEDMEDILRDAGVQILSTQKQNNGSNKYDIVCPWIDEHTDGDESGTFVSEAPGGGKMFFCYHSHGETLRWSHFLAKVQPQNYLEIKKIGKKSSNTEKGGRGGGSKGGRVSPEKSPYLSGKDEKGGRGGRGGSPPPTSEYLDEDIGFPIEVFPESIQKLILEVEESVRCSRDLVAMGVLATLSAAIGNTRRISIKESWLQSAALYCVIVGYPGSKKTAALSFSTKPLRKKADKLHKDYKQLMESYEDQLAHCDKDDEPQKPVEYQNLIDDVTVEKVALILENNPRGIALVKDELSGWLASMDQYKGGKGGERSKWLSVFDNIGFRVDRMGNVSVYVKSPCVTIMGGIQPEKIHEFKEEEGDGFIDRFLMVFPTPQHDVWTDTIVTKETELAYDKHVNALYDLDFNIVDKDYLPKVVELTTDAREVLKDTYNQLAREKSTLGFSRRLTNIWQKLETNWMRIALILSMSRVVEERKAGHQVLEMVTKEDMDNSVKLLNYFKGQSEMMHGDRRTNTDDFSGDLARFLRARNGEWEGYTADLFKELKSEFKATDASGLGAQLIEVSKRSPLLKYTRRRMKRGSYVSLKIEGSI